MRLNTCTLVLLVFPTVCYQHIHVSADITNGCTTVPTVLVPFLYEKPDCVFHINSSAKSVSIVTGDRMKSSCVGRAHLNEDRSILLETLYGCRCYNFCFMRCSVEPIKLSLAPINNDALPANCYEYMFHPHLVFFKITSECTNISSTFGFFISETRFGSFSESS